MAGDLRLTACGETLTMRQAAAVLGVSVRTWRRWRAERNEPIAELEPRTGRPRYARVDVERYLDNPHKGTGWQRRLQAVGW